MILPFWILACTYRKRFPCFYILCPSVFQSKVLQRLFPAAPQYEPSTPPVENPSRTSRMKRKATRSSGKIELVSYFFPNPSWHWCLTLFFLNRCRENPECRWSWQAHVHGATSSCRLPGRFWEILHTPPAGEHKWQGHSWYFDCNHHLWSAQ